MIPAVSGSGGKTGIQVVAVSDDSAAAVSVYRFTGGELGTKFADAASTPGGTSYDVAFNSGYTYIAISNNQTPYVHVYPWSNSGFGTKVSNPATTPGGTRSSSVEWKDNNSVIAVGSNGTPYIQVYAWSGSAFGTKYANPTVLPAGIVEDVAFRPSAAGDFIAAAHDSSPYITHWQFSSSTGFGAQRTAPSPLPVQNARALAYSPDGAYLAVGWNTTAPRFYVYTYRTNEIASSPITDPATVPAGNVNEVDWSPDGAYIAAASQTSPYIQVYPFSAGAFGTKIADPSSAAQALGQGVAFSSGTPQFIGVAELNTAGIGVYNWNGSFGTRISHSVTKNSNAIKFKPTSKP